MVKRARAMKFTPQVLLSAPRRSAGVPNPSGTKVLYTTSSYSFESHKKTIELRVLDIDSGESYELAKNDDISDLNWLNDDDFACLQAEKDSTTSLYVASVSKVIKNTKLGESHYIAGKIPAPASNLKVKKLDPHGEEFAVVVSAEANPDGSLFNAETTKKTHATGRLYNNLMARHWDRWETKQKQALWCGTISRKGNKDGKFAMSKLTNTLKGTDLESPVRPFGGTDSFDISTDRIVFVAKDPELNPALNTKENVYIVNVDSWTDGKTRLEAIDFPDFKGAASSPVFSPDGRKIAFLKMSTNGYEADRNDVFVVIDFKAATKQFQLSTLKTHSWDRSPQSVAFTANSDKLLLVAEERGAAKLFESDPFDDWWQGKSPRTLTQNGSVSDMKPLPSGKIFISGSSIIDNSFYAIVDPLIPAERIEVPITWTNSNSGEGGKLGLNSSQVASIWTPASNPKVNKEVHSIVVRPSNYDSGKKYPVAYIIHGGPQGAWTDSWSTRWNLAVFAEQGYIVIAPNPTGSTGYGQAFTDAIRRNWGGDPYQDIVNVFEWVGKNMSDADNDRAVALGASFGGYMMNWIQGHDLGRKFQCLVCHDGITTFAGAMLPTDELYFPFYDLGGTPWFDPGFKPAPGDSSVAAQGRNNFGAAMLSDWRKWDPSEHFANWATPELVIHSSKDFRLPIAEGLAAFNVLQARGVDSQFLTFEDENHWVLKPENSLLWHKVVLNWINKYAGLEAFAHEDEGSDEFFGGLRDGKEEVAEMPTQGKVEM